MGVKCILPERQNGRRSIRCTASVWCSENRINTNAESEDPKHHIFANCAVVWSVLAKLTLEQSIVFLHKRQPWEIIT